MSAQPLQVQPITARVTRRPQYDNRGLAARIEKRVIKTESGCWIWQGAKMGNGYGKIWTGVKLEGVHRAAYEVFVGPIPAGMVIDHLCRARRCANPAHLEVVTPHENWRRGLSPSILRAGAPTCRRGHAYDEANTYITPAGQRHCRACGRENARRYQPKRQLRRQAKRAAK